MARAVNINPNKPPPGSAPVITLQPKTKSPGSDRVSSRCIVDPARQVVRCERCGEEIPIPLGTLAWVTGVTVAFDLAHKHCSSGDPDDVRRRCWFSTPTGGS